MPRTLAPTQDPIQAPVLIVPAAHPTTLQLHRGFPTPAVVFLPSLSPDDSSDPGTCLGGSPAEIPLQVRGCHPGLDRTSAAGALSAGGDDAPVGAAYRGATPRGAHGSRTRCRGRRRRGTPGSHPAVPQSCRAKRTSLTSTARPCHTSVPPSAAPNAGPLPVLKESSHCVTIIRFQSEWACWGRAWSSAAPAACSAPLCAPVACASVEGNTKLFPSEILQTSSAKMHCNSRKSVHVVMNNVFLLNPSALSPKQIIIIVALQFCWEDLSGPSQTLKKSIFQRDRCSVCGTEPGPGPLPTRMGFCAEC